MNELETIRSCLKDLRIACASDRGVLAKDGTLVEELAAIDKTAVDLLDKFVLRFGVIGDSNAGKSQLIGGLIGLADALPVNKIPFTGNIVVLRICQNAGEKGTQLGPYHLHFITLETAKACAVHLQLVIISELEQLRESARFVQTGGELHQRMLSGSISFETIRPWLNEVWDRAADRNVNLRSRLVELTRFLLTWERLQAALVVRTGTQHLPASDSCLIVEVPRDVAQAAMVLPTTLQESNFMRLVASINDNLTQAIGTNEALQRLPSSIDKKFASICYPLIQEIHLDVRIPVSVWDLSRLQVDAIELYDFPGLAAQVNAGRDAYLSFRERERNRIHTWMIVINATELKGSQASEIVRELPNDRILAVANRFDALPLWIQGDNLELERLSSEQAPPVREREVLNRLDLLPPLTNLFDLLTKPERCVLVSAMIGLVELERGGKVLNVLNESQRRIFPEEVARGVGVQPIWGLMAKKIREIEPYSTLAGWLSDYAQPGGQGGLSRLRDLLFEHANDVGLVQVADELKERLVPVQQKMESLLLRARTKSSESAMHAKELRSRLDQLMTTYQDYGMPPMSIDEIRVCSARMGINFSLPQDTRLLAPPTESTASLREIVHDETLLRVWNWREWRTLLEAVRPDCFVDCSNNAQFETSDDDAPWDREEIPSPPTRAGQLHALFCDAYRQVEAIAMAALRASLMDFLQRLGQKLAPLANDLSFLANNNPTNPVNFAVKPNKQQTVEYLFKNLVPSAPTGQPTSSYWRDRYPYLLNLDEAGNLSLGQHFGWSPERRGPGSRPEHQLYVLRLRSELTTTIESHVLRIMAEALSKFQERLNSMHSRMNSAVASLKDRPNTELLALFGKETTPNTTPAVLAIDAVNQQFLAFTLERV